MNMDYEKIICKACNIPMEIFKNQRSRSFCEPTGSSSTTVVAGVSSGTGRTPIKIVKYICPSCGAEFQRIE